MTWNVGQCETGLLIARRWRLFVEKPCQPCAGSVYFRRAPFVKSRRDLKCERQQRRHQQCPRRSLLTQRSGVDGTGCRGRACINWICTTGSARARCLEDYRAAEILLSAASGGRCRQALVIKWILACTQSSTGRACIVAAASAPG